MSRVAIVSCLPPEQTGVADFTHRLLKVAGETVRGYAGRAARRRFIVGNPLDAARWRVRSLPKLDRDMRRDVGAVVVMLGNSAHFAPIIEWTRAWRARPRTVPLLLYLHDAFLLNVLGHLRDGNAMMEEVAHDHGRTAGHPANFDELVRLVEARMLGAAVIVRHLRPDAVMVNSRAAQALLAQEPGLPGDVRLEAGFHPVFPSAARWSPKAKPRALRIGTFGLVTPLKQLNLIVDAFALVQEREPDATLVIAGYGARRFVSLLRLSGRRGIEVYDAPRDSRLDALMASVDVAVQLRGADLGESSGIVARLLAIGTPTITSARGAALELGEAVTFAGASVVAADLAELMWREGVHTTDRREAVRQYVERHSAQALVSRMAQVAGEAVNRAVVD